MPQFEAPWEFIEKYYTEDLEERDSKESQWALSRLKNVKGKTVLSVGCGPNFFDDVQFFKNVPKEFVGIDINKNNISFLIKSTHPELLRWKKFLCNRGVQVELHEGNIKVKQNDFLRKFDSIYAVGVLGMFNFEDSKRIFNLLNLYLKPGGLLIDIDWTDSYLPDEKIREREKYKWYTPVGPSIEQIGNLLEKTGFEILNNDIHIVQNPESYKWGKIYSFITKKII